RPAVCNHSRSLSQLMNEKIQPSPGRLGVGLSRPRVHGQRIVNYGTVFSNAGVVASASVPTTAQWSGSVSAGANVSVSLTIPSSLSDGAGHTLAFACGTTSALFHADQGAQSGFNPNTGLSSYSVPGTSSGALLLTLGQDPGTGSCTVDVGTLQSGGLFKTYTGNIVATVTVL